MKTDFTVYLLFLVYEAEEVLHNIFRDDGRRYLEDYLAKEQTHGKL